MAGKSMLNYEELVIFRAGLAGTCDIDGGLAGNGTTRLADAAADAETEINLGSLENHLPAFPVLHLHLLQPDGFLRRWANFLADDTGCRVRVGKASSRIDHGEADPDRCFFFRSQFPDGACGTDLSAEGAAVFAIADLRDKNRRPDPFKTGIEECRLKAVGDADLHALAAFDAASEEFFFFQRSRGADQSRIEIVQPREGSCSQQGNGQDAGDDGKGDVSPSQIQRCLCRFSPEPEAHRLCRAWIIAVHAVKALRPIPAFALFCQGAPLAFRDAGPAESAPLAHRSFQ